MVNKKSWWLKPRINELEITVVTDPIPVGFFSITEGLKWWLRKARNIGRNLFNPLPAYLISDYRGHPAVTRSIVQGLEKLNVPFSYNPKTLDNLSQAVVVLSGVSALKQMIKFKQQGHIRCLLAGPNISDDPGSHEEILTSPEIDRYITHAPVCQLIGRLLPTLGLRCVPWAAGVDLSYWCPESQGPRDRVLIYSKQNKGPTVPVEPYRMELERRGYEVSVLEYGSYSVDDYRSVLRRSKCLVGFTRDETQGIAFAEAWACDVPTFIWSNSEPTYLGVAYGGSTAPYLTDATGALFSNVNDFRELLSRWDGGGFAFKPRQWCYDNMSDEVCARNLLAIARSI
jgi:hypothetical protein